MKTQKRTVLLTDIFDICNTLTTTDINHNIDLYLTLREPGSTRIDTGISVNDLKLTASMYYFIEFNGNSDALAAIDISKSENKHCIVVEKNNFIYFKKDRYGLHNNETKQIDWHPLPTTSDELFNFMMEPDTFDVRYFDLMQKILQNTSDVHMEIYLERMDLVY